MENSLKDDSICISGIHDFNAAQKFPRESQEKINKLQTKRKA